MVDQTTYASTQRTDPPGSCVEITPSDTVELVDFSRGIYIDVAGTLRVTMADDTIVNFSALATGVTHAMIVKLIHATGTTATGIKAFH